MLKLLGIAAVVGLAGCAHYQRDAVAFCSSNGFIPGTGMYLACVQNQEGVEEIDRAQRAQAWENLSAAFQRASQQARYNQGLNY